MALKEHIIAWSKRPSARQREVKSRVAGGDALSPKDYHHLPEDALQASEMLEPQLEERRQKLQHINALESNDPLIFEPDLKFACKANGSDKSGSLTASYR